GDFELLGGPPRPAPLGRARCDMQISRDEAVMLGCRAQRPALGPGEVLAWWVPGKLVNTKNARLHPMAEHRYKLKWREAVSLAALESGWILRTPTRAVEPKHVAFRACSYHAMDSDGLQVALAPVRDELIRLGVISGDADRDGHVFTYAQRIDRGQRGVEIRVR